MLRASAIIGAAEHQWVAPARRLSVGTPLNDRAMRLGLRLVSRISTLCYGLLPYGRQLNLSAQSVILTKWGWSRPPTSTRSLGPKRDALLASQWAQAAVRSPLRPHPSGRGAPTAPPPDPGLRAPDAGDPRYSVSRHSGHVLP